MSTTRIGRRGLVLIACVTMLIAGSATITSASDAQSTPGTPQATSSNPSNPGPDRNILIADRGNNRIIEVTPDKRIVWEYDFAGLPAGAGADDAFFSPDNTKIIANLEEKNIIVIIDYASRQVVWQYGEYKPGPGPGHLNTPDDAYLLPNGNITVADIENCRILIISPQKKIVGQIGKTGQCLSQPNFYNRPNGATPLPDGNFLITEIRSRRISEVTPGGTELYSFPSPAYYPSDAQPTQRGTIIVADYTPNGAIYEVDHSGHVLWQFGPFPPSDKDERTLNQPSLAVEMPNGNIIANDDWNHRVVVIDKQTKQIVWQYGHTGIKGVIPDYLYIPDGIDWRHNGGALAAGIAEPEATAQASDQETDQPTIQTTDQATQAEATQAATP